MLAAAMRADGRDPVHNRAGSNMTWGVATALLEQSGDEGLFEVDEAWLPRVVAELEPKLVDPREPLSRPARPLRRARDPRRRLGGDGRRARWAQRLRPQRRRPADRRPRPRRGARSRRPGVTYFGIEDPAVALAELQHAHDAKHCRRCGHPYTYARAFVGHLGHYACPNCGADRPAPDVAATEIELRGMRGSRARIRTPEGEVELELPLPGLYNVYNALAALAAALRLGIGLERAAEALSRVRGRVRAGRDDRGRRSPGLDPAGQEPRRHERGAAHAAPRGRADTGRRARPLDRAQRPDRRRSRRLLGLGRRLRAACRRRPPHSLRGDARAGTRAAAQVRGRRPRADRRRASRSNRASIARSQSADGPLYALPTYTALIELRTLLAPRGLAREFWR